jgi:tight adherence protein B
VVRARPGKGAVVRRRLAALGLLPLVLVLVSVAPAHRAMAESGVAIRDVDVSRFPTVRLVLSTAEPIRLTTRDVHLVENGSPVPTGEVSVLGGPTGRVDAALAIDVSNSMRGTPLQTALAAARTFVSGVPESMPVGVVTFSNRSRVLSPVSADRASVNEAVASIGSSTSAGTALYEAVATAAHLFDAESSDQHNLVLVTDGRNTAGELDLAGAVSAARAAGVHVFTIGLAGSSTDAAPLRALARATGGTYAAISPGELSAVYSGLAREFSSQYVVTYRSKAPLGVAVTVSLRLPVGSASVGFLAPGASAFANERSPAADSPGFWGEPLGMGLIGLLTFLSVAGLGLVVARRDARRRRERQLRSRVGPTLDERGWNAKDAVGAEGTRLVPEAVAQFADEVVGRSGAGRKIARRLEHAGWAITSGEFLTIAAFVAVVLGVLGFALLGPIGAIAGLGIGALAPMIVLSGAVSRRQAAIQGQLADTLMVIASSMRAGHSFLQSLDSASKEIDQPAAGEFARVLQEIRLGRGTDDALDSLVERVGSQDLEWAVTAINIQRKIGGNLAEVLETVANTIRERDTLRRQMRVLSAEGRISAAVLTVLPILIAGYLMIVNPDYLRTLSTTRAGIIISVCAGVLMVIGYLWMRKMVKLDV